MTVNVNKKDAVWSYIATFLSVSASLILIPFILLYMNDNDTAIYYIFSSLSAIAVLFDFGFSPVMARSMTYAWSGAKSLKEQGVEKTESIEPNYRLMMLIIKSCQFIYLILAIGALVLCLSVGTAYICHVTKQEFYVSYVVSWIIYSVAIFLNILYSYYSVFLRGIGAISKVNIATVVSKVIQMFICILLLFFGCGLIGVAVAYILYGIIFRLLAKKWFYEYGMIRVKLQEVADDVSKKEIYESFRTIWPNTWRDGVVTLSNYLLNQATTIIASLFLSLQETGIYSISVQLTSVIATIAATLYTTYQPMLQSAYVNRDNRRQKKCMSIIVVSYVLIFGIGIIGVIAVGIPILKILKPTYVINISVLLCIAAYQFILKLRNCYTSFISTTNRITYWKSFLCSALVCVTMSCVLSGKFKMGVWGLVYAQLFSQLIYNVWYWPYVVHKELKMSFYETLQIGTREILGLMQRK